MDKRGERLRNARVKQTWRAETGGTAFPVFPLKIGKKASDSDEIKVERGPSLRCERGEESRGELAGLLEAERFHTGPETSVTQLDHLAHDF